MLADVDESVTGSAEYDGILLKTQRMLEDRKLEITKNWLNRLIAQIDDLAALERFPTQESIHTSVELIGGLSACLTDQTALQGFRPGGVHYKEAAVLGLLQKDGEKSMVALAQSLESLEGAVWEVLADGLRRQDREVLRMVTVLREALHGVVTAATEAFHQQASAELDRLAHTDPLTGLSNRRHMILELERHVEMYKRYRHIFSILMLDLDNLKSLNDALGHAAGDSALRHIANVMRANIRDVDIPCRYGGDEFLILMPETDEASVQAVGRRISESVTKTRLKIGRTLATLNVSYGASSCPTNGVESEMLLQEADAALYRAKHEKASQTVEFT